MSSCTTTTKSDFSESLVKNSESGKPDTKGRSASTADELSPRKDKRKVTTSDGGRPYPVRPIPASLRRTSGGNEPISSTVNLVVGKKFLRENLLRHGVVHVCVSRRTAKKSQFCALDSANTPNFFKSPTQTHYRMVVCMTACQKNLDCSTNAALPASPSAVRFKCIATLPLGWQTVQNNAHCVPSRSIETYLMPCNVSAFSAITSAHRVECQLLLYQLRYPRNATAL